MEVDQDQIHLLVPLVTSAERRFKGTFKSKNENRGPTSTKGIVVLRPQLYK